MNKYVQNRVRPAFSYCEKGDAVGRVDKGADFSGFPIPIIQSKKTLRPQACFPN